MWHTFLASMLAPRCSSSFKTVVRPYTAAWKSGVLPPLSRASMLAPLSRSLPTSTSSHLDEASTSGVSWSGCVRDGSARRNDIFERVHTAAGSQGRARTPGLSISCDRSVPSVRSRSTALLSHASTASRNDGFCEEERTFFLGRFRSSLVAMTEHASSTLTQRSRHLIAQNLILCGARRGESIRVSIHRSRCSYYNNGLTSPDTHKLTKAIKGAVGRFKATGGD